MVDCKWIPLDYKSLSKEESHYIKFFDRSIIDQKRAKEKISAKLAAYKHDLNEKDKPAGVLFFPGPSGVGKTFLVEVFAKLLIGDINGFTKIDCSNLQESHTISRLLGSPPGYVGYKDEPEFAQSKLDRPWRESHPHFPTKEEKSQLDALNLELFNLNLELQDLEDEEESEKDAKKADAIKLKIKEKKISYFKKITEIEEFTKTKEKEYAQKPCPSILLLDEIEKIHPSITRALLPIFDKGETKLASGEKVDFRNCFIFMTSNIGSKRIAETLSGKGPIGFVTNSQEKQKELDIGTIMYETVMEEINKSEHFPTELIGRIGKENIVICHPLSSSGIQSIIDLQLSELQKKISSACPKTKLIFSQGLKNFLFEETRDPLNIALGARPIKNVIKAKIMEPLLNLIIKGNEGGISHGDLVRIGIEESEGKKKILIEKAMNKNGVDIVKE